MILFASDLDNTLIYSYKKEIREKVLVELKEGKKLSYMTEYSYNMLKELEEQVCFVPVTTRSMEQFRRIRLKTNSASEYALVSNGGILLKNGEVDLNWYEESKCLVQSLSGVFDYAKDLLRLDKHLILDVRMVDELFLFTKSSRPKETQTMLQKELKEMGVSVYTNREKIYVLPNWLNKGKALKRLRNIIDFTYLIAGGDSLFDIPMLLEADMAVFPECLNSEKLEEHPNKRVVANDHFLSDTLLECVKELIGGRQG